MALERQVRAKLMGKRDADQEGAAQEWIESVLGQKFPAGAPYEDVLQDGTVLCQLLNKLHPGSVSKINTSGGQFKMMENITNFAKGIEKYGVPKQDIFQTVDLWEKKDISQVTTCLFALGRTTYKHPEWPGPWLGPRPSEENKREFSDETIAAGKTAIGLQAGSNKGASQAGSNLGAGRKIILGK